MPNPSWAFSNADGASGATDNPTSERSIYPTSPGGTAGSASGAASLVTSGASAGPGGVTTTGAASNVGTGFFGQPLTWWATIIVVFIVLGVVARKAGNESEFGNLRVSAYNILMITLAAIIGIAAMKIIFTRFNVPGFSALVQAV